MQLYHVPAASPLVQPIHVLRHEGEARDPTLELCERQVSRGRLGLRHEFAPPLVALPHQAWIPVGSLSGREPLMIVALPEPCLGLAEGWHPLSAEIPEPVSATTRSASPRAPIRSCGISCVLTSYQLKHLEIFLSCTMSADLCRLAPLSSASAIGSA